MNPSMILCRSIYPPLPPDRRLHALRVAWAAQRETITKILAERKRQWAASEAGIAARAELQRREEQAAKQREGIQ
jgi:hypothetical protein